MDRPRYPTDLTDVQQAVIEPHLPQDSVLGRKREVPLLEVINAIFYVNRAGCQWDMLPHDFPNYKTVNFYFNKWRDEGTWDKILTALRESVRVEDGREATPSAASIDSQTGKTTSVPGERGYEGGKKKVGRKRHILVDSMGWLLAVVVTAAHVSDAHAAVDLMQRAASSPNAVEGFVTEDLKVVWADGADNKEGFPDDVEQECAFDLQIKTRPKEAKGFQVIPKRWVVERSLGWLIRCRRLVRDSERSVSSSEAMTKISMIRLLLNRLEPDQNENPPFKFHT